MNLGAVNVAAVTPHRQNGYDADLGSTLDLVDYLCSAGVHGIALLGTTGEFPHLNLEDRAHLVRLSAKRSRIPIIAGVTHSTLDGTVVLAEQAADSGVAAVLVMPPYFFSYGQAEIREFYLRFADRITSGIPILLYNIPVFTSPISIETSRELLATGRFAGIKDSSGSFDAFLQLKAQRRSVPFTILAGSDRIFTLARSAGADGVVSGVACAIPELLLALDRAIQGADAEATTLLESRLQEFLQWLDRFPAPVGVREACAARGLKVGPLAVPLSPEKARELDQFKSWFQAWAPAVQKECSALAQKVGSKA
jgi:4-hydroxy-tetrahydrodipicolinate synthase